MKNKVIPIDPAVHHDLKVYCAQNGILMKPFIETLVLEGINEKKGNVPLK